MRPPLPAWGGQAQSPSSLRPRHFPSTDQRTGLVMGTRPNSTPTLPQPEGLLERWGEGGLWGLCQPQSS